MGGTGAAIISPRPKTYSVVGEVSCCFFLLLIGTNMLHSKVFVLCPVVLDLWIYEKALLLLFALLFCFLLNLEVVEHPLYY